MRPPAAPCIVLLLLVTLQHSTHAHRGLLQDSDDLDELGPVPVTPAKADLNDAGADTRDLISKLRQEEEAAEQGLASAEDEEEADTLAASRASGDVRQSVATPGTDAASLLDLDTPRSEGTAASTLAQSAGSSATANSDPIASASSVGSTAAAAAAKPEAKPAADDGTPAPIQKFKIYNEQWLEQAEGIAEDFVSTPAMQRLKSGSFGAVDLKALGIDGATALATGVHAVLSRCLHTLNLFKAVNMFHDGVLPKWEVLPECTHRKFRLLFVLEKGSDYWKRRDIVSELASVNIRLFPFAAALAKRGHTTLVADPDHFHQVNMKKLDAIIFVKVLEQGYQLLQNSSVPLIWDHVDEWDGFPFWNLEQWALKEKFAGVLTAGRMAKVAFDKAGVPAQVLYHNHANFANIHRADRTKPVRVLALQGDYHSHDSDIFPMLEGYCKKNNLTFRSGHYTGRGWDVQEYSQQLKEGVPNYGNQIGWYMGFKSVDVAVLWPKGYTQFHVCYKPTSRLAYFASLGIPLVTYPFASYIDILVEFGYPLVAETLEEAGSMLDKLLASPQLRQEASEKLLEIARFLSVDELVEQYEQALCQFLSPEALKLRKGMGGGDSAEPEQQLQQT